MNNCVIDEEQLTLINDFLVSSNSSFTSRSLIVKISSIFQVLYSTLLFLLIHSWKNKIWCFEKWTNMEESWTKTRSIGEILTIKEHEINDELQNARKSLISVRYVSNTT